MESGTVVIIAAVGASLFILSLLMFFVWKFFCNKTKIGLLHGIEYQEYTREEISLTFNHIVVKQEDEEQEVVPDSIRIGDDKIICNEAFILGEISDIEIVQGMVDSESLTISPTFSIQSEFEFPCHALPPNSKDKEKEERKRESLRRASNRYRNKRKIEDKELFQYEKQLKQDNEVQKRQLEAMEKEAEMLRKCIADNIKTSEKLETEIYKYLMRRVTGASTEPQVETKVLQDVTKKIAESENKEIIKTAVTNAWSKLTVELKT